METLIKIFACIGVFFVWLVCGLFINKEDENEEETIISIITFWILSIGAISFMIFIFL